MYALINQSVPGMAAAGPEETGSDPYREYWDPHTRHGHGTGGFSWTAALFLDTFCPRQLFAPTGPGGTSNKVRIMVVGYRKASCMLPSVNLWLYCDASPLATADRWSYPRRQAARMA